MKGWKYLLVFMISAQKQRCREQRESRQRQRKEHRQVMKEKRSGLFRREQVLSLATSLVKEMEEVDILT